MKSILLFLFFPFLLYSQNCKYSKNQVDEFTGNVEKITKQVMIYNGLAGGLAIKLSKINNYIYLDMGYSRTDIFTIMKGDAIIFILKNKEKVELKSLKTEVSKPYTGQFGTIWSVEMSYGISEDDLNKIIKSPISKLRIYTNQTYIDKEVSENKALKIQEITKCII